MRTIPQGIGIGNETFCLCRTYHETGTCEHNKISLSKNQHKTESDYIVQFKDKFRMSDVPNTHNSYPFNIPQMEYDALLDFIESL